MRPEAIELNLAFLAALEALNANADVQEREEDEDGRLQGAEEGGGGQEAAIADEQGLTSNRGGAEAARAADAAG